VYVTHDQIEAMTMADRIVVMHDGLVEQIGTPLQLYDRPGNLFVAQFIGSPAMNMVEGVLKQHDGRAWVEALGRQWPAHPLAGAADGQAVHYGVRPSDIVPATSGGGVAAQVIVVEPTGAETELLVEVAGKQLIAVIHGRTAAQPGDAVFLGIDGASAHLFSAADGKRLN
jgi:multiple sugar transport system ATP-binding protein